MLRIALRGLVSRKLRTALTALAVVVGISMVAGTYVLTDTIDKSFDSLMASARAGTAAVISGKSTVAAEDTSQHPSVPASLIEPVSGLPGVARAYGLVEVETARMIDDDGDPVGVAGPPALGFGLDAANIGQDSAFKIIEGRWAEGPGEVVIDSTSAERAHLSVGDTVRIEGSGPLRRFRITGLLQWGRSNSLGGATMAVLDLATGQKLFGFDGRLSEIDIETRDGYTPEQIVSEVEPLLPAQTRVMTVAEQIKDDQAEWSAFAKIIRYVFLTFAGIALFVGAFVIFNTLSITVAQRTREMATLRTLGASRRQILSGVIAEGLAIGAVASALGIGLGIGLARVLSWVVGAIGIDVPRTETVYALRTFVVSMGVGIVVTLLASLVPALRATRVPPIAAVREGAALPGGRLARLRPAVSGLLLLLSLAVVGVSLFGSFDDPVRRLITLAAGCALFFIAVAFASSYVARPLARLAGAPGKLVGGVAGKLARENAMRSPGRTASTAAALMIGLALVTFVSVLSAGLNRSIEVAIRKQGSADYVVMAKDGYSSFPNAVSRRLEKAPGVAKSIALRSDVARTFGKETDVTALDPKQALAVYRFNWKEGSNASLAELRSDGAIVTEKFANSHKLSRGSGFQMTMPNGHRLRLHVIGVNKQPELVTLLGDVTISQVTFDSLYRNPKTTQLNYLIADKGQSKTLERSVEAALKAFPDVQLYSEQEAIDLQSSDMGTLLQMFYVLLGLAIVVSVFGIVNTLALAVFERTRELGMLRAVGMTKRQARRMIRYESVTISLIGAALGIPVGIFLSALATSALQRYDIVFSLPAGSLAVFIAVAIAAGMLAAILPARRASRLDVLEALQYE
jgi:putative ABC transport system permease protein